MKAVTYQKLPIAHPDSLTDSILPMPIIGPRDILVEVRAISVNPLDAKIRAGGGPRGHDDAPTILGWDAAGVVTAIGRDVTLFSPGDEVYYAGAVNRNGSYAQYQAVDERIVGNKPKSLTFAQAAALPLTSITAWELLFERMRAPLDQPTSGGSLLIVGGAGGMGSIASQLARALTGLTVISSASRKDTQDWVRKMGAHHVVDHGQPLAAQAKAIVPGGVDYILALTKTEAHFDQLIDAFAPQGALGLIEIPATPLDINRMRPKSLSLHWEFIFTRALMQTADMNKQGAILNRVVELVDAGLIKSTINVELGEINAGNLKQAHALVESGKTIGKIVLAGFAA